MDERAGLKNAAKPKINTRIEQTIAPDSFIDIQALICAPDWACPLFGGNAALLSYDGTHLTKAGAKFVGERLLTHPLVSEALKLNEF